MSTANLNTNLIEVLNIANQDVLSIKDFLDLLKMIVDIRKIELAGSLAIQPGSSTKCAIRISVDEALNPFERRLVTTELLNFWSDCPLRQWNTDGTKEFDPVVKHLFLGWIQELLSGMGLDTWFGPPVVLPVDSCIGAN